MRVFLFKKSLIIFDVIIYKEHQLQEVRNNFRHKFPIAFYFTKYNSKTTSQHFFKYSKEKTVICFDLEDSVNCWINMENNANLKNEKRKILTELLSGWEDKIVETKTAVRINSSESPEQINDICSLKQITNISYIIIPKVNSVTDIEITTESLLKNNIKFSEIIPVIETKEGLVNLNIILKAFPQIKKFFFGHYDYNLDIKALPFFHQDSIEYWKWVIKMIEIARQHNIVFINSPYTKLNDLNFFKSMLKYLFTISKGEFGQVTMNSAQTQCCNEFQISENTEVESIARDRHSYRYNDQELKNIIETFENENNGMAFSLIKDNEILSPHEYECAKFHLEKSTKDLKNLLFVGGCFPVQYNIFPEDTFHFLLKERLEEYKGINLNLDIIRYERFRKCFEKIKKHHAKQEIDYLVFHIRHEPLLRLIKFIYKYQDDELNKRWSLNLPFSSNSNPEEYDLMNLVRHNNPHRKSNTLLKSFLINANYLTGCATGNFRSASKKYFEMVKQLINYCNDNKIKLIIIGPPKRIEFISETFISSKFEEFISKELHKLNIDFINGYLEHKVGNINYFSEDGKHATEEYHKLIADALYEKISSDLQNIKA